MTDEIRPEGQATETPPTSQEPATAVATGEPAPSGDVGTATAVAPGEHGEHGEHGQSSEAAPASETAETGEAAEDKDKEKIKLRQDVEIKDAGGPCKKHIRVSVNREDIDGRFKEHYSKLVKESSVRGFRPGKAPRRIVEKQFQKQVGDQVKNEVLMASLQQLGEDHHIAPLSEPNLNLDSIEIPREGPLVYEFEVEVRPEFDLPNYRGMKLKRPTKTFDASDVADARRRLLARHGQVVPKEEGAVEPGDIIVAEVVVRDGDQVIGTIPENRFTVEKQLSFKDGLARRFAEQVSGAKAGETRVVDVEISSTAAAHSGKTVQASFDIRDIKTLRLPPLTPDFLEQTYGVSTPEDFDEAILVLLNRNLEHNQRRAAREQIIGQISTAQWELPQDLLMRQARRALNRRIMEMRSDGIPEAEINQQRRLLEQNVLETTAVSLREHFVLQKIAEVEKIDVNEDDINDEIERIAEQEGESPRKVRARLEKEDMIEALAAEMIERKALDLILDNAEYEDVPLDRETSTPQTSSVEAQAVPGQMQELPTDANPPQPQSEETKAEAGNQ